MVIALGEHVLHFLLDPASFQQYFETFLRPEESSDKHVSLSKHIVRNFFFTVWSYFQEHVEWILVLAWLFQDVECHSGNLAIFVACIIEQQGEAPVVEEVFISENHSEVLKDVPAK